HTAVWTGQEMIVWGGAAAGALSNTGGRYDPATDGWLATNPTDAPSPRWIHSAVWTGSEMIIWGGLVNGDFPFQSTNTGARYNPATGAWIATPLLRAPEQRDAHTAVWTGSQMLVWGGVLDPDTRYTNTGGVYYVEAAPRVAPTTVVSRKVHGAAGSFDVPLPLEGAAGIECRSGGLGGNYQVVVAFPSAVSLNGVAVMPEGGKSGNLAAAPLISADGRTITLNLTNVSDAQTVTINLSGINNGTNFNDVSVPLRVLVGDTNGSGVVSASDISQTKARAGQDVTASTFRSDVVANGAINTSDIGLVKSRSGTAPAAAQ
ncbi:MAG: dockerin type I domain-containing protein, partial [Chthoniobacterales bacterium]